MANIGTELKNWSTTEASNQPDSTDPTTIAGDFRAIQAAIRLAIASQDTIASATTCDLGSKTAGSLTISGTTTITGLGTVSAGIRKSCVFSGILTLTHNGTSLILPGAANITTAANDRAEFESLGSGNWRCNWYVKASGQPIISPLSDGDKGDITVSASGATWTLDETVITGKSAETAPAIDDLLLISDTSETAALNKMSLENLLKVIDGLTEDTSPDTAADFVLTYDTSASGVKKAKPANLAPGITSGTAASASGTSVDFTGIPSGKKRVIMLLSGISTSGTSNIIIQIGDSGGVETSSYTGTGGIIGGFATLTSGFFVSNSVGAANAYHGGLILELLDAATNTWVAIGIFGRSDAASIAVVGGTKALSATLDRIRLTTAGGTDTFDAGTINIFYE